MNKKVVFLTVAILLTGALKAQSIQDTVVRIGVQTVPGFYATISQDVKSAQEALKQKMKAAKLKTTNSEGYTASLGQVVPDLATVPVNLYVKIEEQGRRSEKATAITICAMPMNIADKVPDLNNYVRRYLEDLMKQTSRAEASEQLAASEKALKKAQKDYDNAVADLNKLDKELNKNSDKIASNQKEIEKLQAKLKSLEEDNAKMQKTLDKSDEQKAKLQKTIDESNQELQKAQGEVDKWKGMM